MKNPMLGQRRRYLIHRIAFGGIGAFLGILLAFVLANFMDYLSGPLKNPSLGELGMPLAIFGTPILGILGIVIGILYARKYK